MKTKEIIRPIKEIVKQTNLHHIAIIMDGNRRWAKMHNVPSFAGHQQGVNSFKNIVYYCDEIGVDFLTVYAFSTENWNRNPVEVGFLMKLLVQTINKEFRELHENNVKLKIIGDVAELSPELRKSINDIETLTENNTGLNLQVAINYGSRNELKNAVKNIVNDVKLDKIDPSDITEELIGQYLYTADIPDPDLLIRTGGEQRISNYLLWQIAYSEIYVTERLWPEFTPNALDDAIEEFANRERRFGGN